MTINQNEKSNNIIFAALLFFFAASLVLESLIAYVILIFGSLAYAVFSKNRFKSIALSLALLCLFYLYAIVTGISITFAELRQSIFSVFPFLAAFLISVYFAAANDEDKRKQVLYYILSGAAFSSMIIIFLSGIN